MNVLRAKQRSTNKWLQRIDTEKPEAGFQDECASQFGIAVSDIDVVTTSWTESQRRAAVSEMAAGSHDGLAVIAAATPPRTPSGRSFLKGAVVPNITGATMAAKLDRLSLLYVTDPALAGVLNVCNTYETFTSGDHTFVRKLWARKSVGGLSGGEIAAIEAAAPAYGITLP